MAYTPTVYVNGTTPAISDVNLNKTENGLAAAAAIADAANAKVTDLPEFSTSAQTAAVGTPANMLSKITRYDTTGGAISQTLPAATAGATFAIGRDAGTAALTFTAAGSDVIGSGSTTSFVMPLLGEVLTYHCTTAGRWRSTSGLKTQSSLDARYPINSTTTDLTGAAVGDLLAVTAVSGGAATAFARTSRPALLAQSALLASYIGV